MQVGRPSVKSMDAGGAAPAVGGPGKGKALEKLNNALDNNDEKAIEELKNHPRAQSLTAKLRDPEARKKLEDKLGPELLAKLDKIFNAQAPGTPQPGELGAPLPPVDPGAGT